MALKTWGFETVMHFQLHDLGQVTSSPLTSVFASIKWGGGEVGGCHFLLYRAVMRIDEATHKMYLTHCLAHSK